MAVQATFLVAAFAAATFAASDGGTLRVHVVKPADVAATVVVVDSADTANQRRVTVDAGDVVVLDGLAPGTYELAVTAGEEEARGRVTLDAQWVTIVQAVTSSGGTASALVQTVDRYRLGEGADFDERRLRALPTADNLWSLIETAAPFVVVDRMDTGGLGTGRAGLMGSRGESWAVATVTMAGLPVRLPTSTGLLPVAPDMNAAAAVAVTSGLAAVEVETPGVAVDIVPRRPGASWRGGLDTSLTTRGMVDTNALPLAPSLGRMDGWRNIGVFGGGPIADRTGLFVSAGLTRVSFSERDLPQPFGAATSTIFSHVVSNPSTRDQIRVIAALERTRHPFDGREQFRDTDVHQYNTFGRGQVTWDHVAENGAHRAIAIGLQRGSWSPDVAADAAGGTIDRARYGAMPAPAADITHTQVDGRLHWGAPVLRWGQAHHLVRAGLTLRRSTASSRVVALPTVAEAVAGLPARVWVPISPTAESHRALHEVGVFIGDRVAFGPSLTVDLGVRADIARGAAEGNETGIRWNTLAPRAAFRWRHSALAVFGGAGRYTGGHPLSFLSFGDPGEATWDVRRWHDLDGNGFYDGGEAGITVARAGRGPGVASLDPELRVPTSVEWTIGGELQPSSHSVLRGAIVVRRHRHLAGVLNTGVPLSSYRLFYVPDINADEGSSHDDQLLPVYERLPSSFGQDALVLSTPDDGRLTYGGIELTYRFETTRWFMLFGATAYRTRGWGGVLGHGPLENDHLILGDRYWNPNAMKDEYGSLFFDRSYVGKWSGAYRATDNLLFAFATRYQDGQPFTRMVVAPDLAGGPEIVHAYRVGRTRFTYTATVDARIEQSFRVGTRRAAIRLDVFNLTNHSNELEEDVVSGPAFRQSTVVQPPRTLRLGLRLDF